MSWSADDFRPTVEERERMRQRMEAAIREEQRTSVAHLAAGPKKRHLVISGLIIVLAATAVIIPAALFWGGPSPAEPPDSPVAASPPISSSTTVATSIPITDWTSTELPAAVEAIATHKELFVAVSAGSVLSSGDGVDWSEVGRLPDNSSVNELVSYGGALVAEGSEITWGSDGDKDLDPTLWVSTDDGVTWSPTLAGESVRDLVSTPAGLVAIGQLNLPAVGDRSPTGAAAWISDNGIDWTLAWRADADVSSSSIADTAVWNDGLVVMGRQGPARFSEGEEGGEPWHRVAWAGPTAASLTASHTPNFLGFIQDLAGSNSGQFALTYGIDPSVKESSAVWRSENGLDWGEVDLGKGWSYESIAVDGSTIVIGGHTLGASPDPEARVWYSIDGIRWSDIDTSTFPERVRMGSVVLHHGVLVVSLRHDVENRGYLVSLHIDS